MASLSEIHAAVKARRYWNWNGGRFKSKEGYVYVLRKDHPFARSDGYVPEHRLVMEDYYNCYLLPSVDVHHKNGIRDDNRLENLEVLPHWEHASIGSRKDTTGWTCSECGREKTTFRKPNSRYPRGRHEWHYRRGHKFDTSQLLCASCYSRIYIRKPKEAFVE